MTTQTTTAWLIEKLINGVPHWWTRQPNQFGYWDGPDRWTTDSYKARKYNSKADADHVIGSDMVGCFATEHSWDMEILRDGDDQ